MTHLQRSVFVIPSYAIEDLPTNIGHQLAADFLAAWTAQWDPRVLAALKTLPEWKRTDSSALDLEAALIVCPQLCLEKVDQPQRERLMLGQCSVIDSASRPRPEIVHAILTALHEHGHENLLGNDGTATTAPAFLSDFYALGYAVLQVQIMARKLRYSWNLDWIAFSEQVLAAAEASLRGDIDETERWIQASFDAISQERDRYCSQQIHLLEVVLLAESTLGETLTQQLRSQHPSNVIATAKLLTQCKGSNLDGWNLLVSKLQSKEVSLVGGLAEESIASQQPYRTLYRELQRGADQLEKIGLPRPTVFAQFSPGISHVHPELLRSFGYVGALVNAWSGGTVPTKDTAKIRWQSHSDSEPLDSILGHVQDASNAETFLHLTSSLSKQLDYHHVPTLILAHWPSRAAEAFEDLLRVMARSPALGHLETADKYFTTTNQPYSSDVFSNLQFKVPVPSTAEQRHGLQKSILCKTRNAAQTARIRSSAHLWHQVSPQSISADEIQKAELLEHSVLDCSSEATNGIGIGEYRNHLLQKIALAAGNTPDTTSPNGYLLVNPSSHPQRLFLRNVPGEIAPSSCNRIVDCNTNAGYSNLVIDIPPTGFVRVKADKLGNTQPAAAPRVVNKSSLWKKISGKRTEIADSDWTMSNEFMELQIDPKRGHLRSVFVPNKRGSRMSGMASVVAGTQQDQRRWQESDFLPLEDVQLRLVESTSVCGCIESTGRVRCKGQAIELTTRYTLWKGSRGLEIEIESSAFPEEAAHVVWRTAWANESATIAVWQQGTKGKLPSAMQSAIELIEIDDIENKLYLVAPGLSVHNRYEMRYLVTPLPADSGRTKFKLWLGMDWSRPYETAQDMIDEPWIVPIRWDANQVDAGAWLAQSSLANIRLEWDSTVRSTPEAAEGDTPHPPADAVLWAHETLGKRGMTRLSFFKNVEEAWRIDAIGKESTKLDVEEGCIHATLRPFEQCRIALRWAKTT